MLCRVLRPQRSAEATRQGRGKRSGTRARKIGRTDDAVASAAAACASAIQDWPCSLVMPRKARRYAPHFLCASLCFS